MKIIKLFILEVGSQENISEIFGRKIVRRMRNLAICSCAVTVLMCLVIPLVRSLQFKDGKMVFMPLHQAFG